MRVLGNPLPRSGPPPCLFDNCDKGRYDNPKTLLPINQKALTHYFLCKSVNQFPEDDTVRHNAWIISRALEEAKNAKLRERTESQSHFLQ